MLKRTITRKRKRALCYLAAAVYINLSVFCIKDSVQAQGREKELFSRPNALVKASLVYIKLKNYDKAEKALDAAYRIADKIDEQLSRAIILSEIADKYIMLDKNEKAFKIAGVIAFADVREDAFTKVAYRYIEQSEYKKALEAASRIESPFAQALALYKMVNRLTDIGLYEEAIKIAKVMGSSRVMVNKLVTLQIHLKKALKRDNDLVKRQLLPQSKSLAEPYLKAKELVAAAQQYLSLILYEPAKNILSLATLIAEDIKPESLKKDILYKIGITYGRIRGFEEKYKITDDKE